MYAIYVLRFLEVAAGIATIICGKKLPFQKQKTLNICPMLQT